MESFEGESRQCERSVTSELMRSFREIFYEGVFDQLSGLKEVHNRELVALPRKRTITECRHGSAISHVPGQGAVDLLVTVLISLSELQLRSIMALY